MARAASWMRSAAWGPQMVLGAEVNDTLAAMRLEEKRKAGAAGPAHLNRPEKSGEETTL